MKRGWSKFSADEVERRRQASIAALERLNDEAFARWYREQCDRLYWSRGKCCAGCDHWISSAGNTGECSAAGIVPDVFKSLGITFTTYLPAPGFPFTRATAHCGKFRDEFDWSTLDREYLAAIGAIRNGELRSKPTTVATDAIRSMGERG